MKKCKECKKEVPKEQVSKLGYCPTCWDNWYQTYMGIRITLDEERRSHSNNDRLVNKDMGNKP